MVQENDPKLSQHALDLSDLYLALLLRRPRPSFVFRVLVCGRCEECNARTEMCGLDSGVRNQTEQRMQIDKICL